jgi:group I intron endonuclease
MYYIYRILHRKSNRSYIGLTTNPLSRWRNHKLKTSGCTRIRNAIQKYGANEFDISVIDECATLQQANVLETNYIIEYNSVNNGFNLQSGGANPPLSEETKEKISRSKMGDRNSFFGKHHSDETKKVLSQRIVSEQTRKKISSGRTGLHMSAETKQKISNTQKGRPKSAEHKAKISAGVKKSLEGNHS